MALRPVLKFLKTDIGAHHGVVASARDVETAEHSQHSLGTVLGTASSRLAAASACRTARAGTVEVAACRVAPQMRRAVVLQTAAVADPVTAKVAEQAWQTSSWTLREASD